MVRDGCKCYFSFWAMFCPFTPLTARKMKFSKKWKKAWRCHHFTHVPKIMIIWYTVSEIWHVTDVIAIFHFGQFFAVLPLTAQKTKISKKMKEAWRYQHFTQVYQKLWFDDVRFLRHGAGWTDRRTEKVTHRCRCPT